MASTFMHQLRRQFPAPVPAGKNMLKKIATSYKGDGCLSQVSRENTHVTSPKCGCCSRELHITGENTIIRAPKFSGLVDACCAQRRHAPNLGVGWMFPKLRIKESAAKMWSLRSPYPCLRIAGQSDSHDLHLLGFGEWRLRVADLRQAA